MTILIRAGGSFKNNGCDKPIEERVNFKSLDQYLKAGLIENGLGDMDYHFKVIDREGREVYRCADYSDAGSESSYSQPLFLKLTRSSIGLSLALYTICNTTSSTNARW